MQPTDTPTRRSVFRTFLASVAAAGAGLFGGAAHAQTAEPTKKTSTDDQPESAKPPLFLPVYCSRSAINTVRAQSGREL